jgi:hypothetical protein
VVRLQFPTSLVPASNQTSAPKIPTLQLTSSDLDDVRTKIEGLQEKYGPVGAFLHLHPSPKEQTSFSETERELVKQIFFMAKTLHNDLTQPPESGRNAFLVVTQIDGKLGLISPEPFQESRGLPGLVKTLRWEWQSVFCRSLDLDPELSPDKKTTFILQELNDPDSRLIEVGAGNEGRFTITQGTHHAKVN